MTDDIRLEHLSPRDTAGRAAVARFLAGFGLDFDDVPDFTVLLKDAAGAVVGTGSFQGEVLRNIAVDERLQGEGLTSQLLSALMQEMARRGLAHYFIYTKPDAATQFANLGFAEVARAEPLAVLLESGLGSVTGYTDHVAGLCAHLPPERGAVVMNANPFTLGHLALVERAAAAHAGVIVFVVSHEGSTFPFAERFRLVREGVAHVPGVVVVPSGPYIISPATFPTYFTKGDARIAAQTRLDANLFARRIAPPLQISGRFVGEEPFCPVTAAYNAALAEALPRAGIGFTVMPRVAVDGAAVSASRVRALWREGRLAEVAKLVPPATDTALQTVTAEALGAASGRH